MPLALVFALLIFSAGYATLRGLCLAKGLPSLGLAPAAGLASTIVLSTWTGLPGAPAPLPGLLVILWGLVGLVFAWRDRDSLVTAARGLARQDPSAATLFAAALLVPVVSMGLAFGAVQAPLSPHDGAFHVETIDAFRRGAPTASWYPPGLAALFAAVLQPFVGVDSAGGAVDLGMGLTLLAPVAVFGLASATSTHLRAAGGASVLLSLTHVFPYYPQVWSGWPQLLGILLVIGVWIVALQYLDRPSPRYAILASLLLGAIVLTHGTELYTTFVVALLVAVANLRRISWGKLAPHALLAGVVGVGLALPYLPMLLHWAGSGGAYQVGLEDGGALALGAQSTTSAQLLAVFTVDALGVDLPVRVVLVVLGLVWALRRPAGQSTVVAVTAGFFALAIIATFLNALPIVRQVFSATYPWSLPYRHLTFAAVSLAVIGGGGCAWTADAWKRVLQKVRGPVAHRRLLRLGRMLVLTWLILGTWALTAFLSIEADADSSFSTDDGAAMAWMRQNVEPGAVVVNDTFADAGIWAPYKAGVRILFYRSVDDPATVSQRALVLQHVGELDQQPEAAAAACALNARYVYVGEDNTTWQKRSFPPLEVLRASSALEEVFARGGAVVFRTRLACDPRG